MRKTKFLINIYGTCQIVLPCKHGKLLLLSVINLIWRLKEETHIAPKKEKREREERSKEYRGRRRERPQTIQSHSIFEQGPADTFRKIGKHTSKRRMSCCLTGAVCITYPVYIFFNLRDVCVGFFVLYKSLKV